MVGRRTADLVAGIVFLSVLVTFAAYAIFSGEMFRAGPSSSSGLIEGLLFPSLVWALRLGAIILAAFVAAAIVQRVLRGRYEFKLGFLDVPAITEDDVAQAGNKIVDEIGASEEAAAPPEPPIAQGDPGLQLVALRIEIEKKVRRLLTDRGIDASRLSLNQMIRELELREVISAVVATALSDLVATANLAAHGAIVTEGAGRWATTQGPSVLAALDALIDRGEPPPVAVSR